MSKQESTEWKHEIARAERKSRLSRMKGTDGHKKKIESGNTGRKVTLSVIAVVLVLAVLVWIVAATGLVTRSATALTVADRKLTAADVNIMLGNLMASEQYGLAFTDEFQELLDQPSSQNEGSTIRNDLINDMMPSIVYMYAVLSEADRAGFIPDAEQSKEMDEAVESIKQQFAEMSVSSGRSMSNLLKLYFGPGAGMSLVERDLRNSMRVNYYQDVIREGADLGDDKVEEFYEENKDALDLYSYHSYVFPVKTEEGATDEDKKQALKDLEEKLKPALEDLKTMSFADTVVQYLSKEDAVAVETDPDSLAYKNMRASRLTTAIFDFFKEEGRKAGDAKLIAGTTSVTLIQYDGRVRDNFHNYSVRHILIADPDEDGKMTDAELKKQADDVLAEFLAGDRTVESFVKLVEAHSQDPGSNKAGGLYEDVALGTMVSEFEDWCLAEGRQKGDTGIVKSTHGYHVMYFEGLDEEAAMPSRIRDALKETHLNDWIDEVTEKATVVRHPLGMKFVGKLDFWNALFGPVPQEPKETVPELEPQG
ncbi:MAG TPA: hypothetical protein GX720_02230 [Clostridiaceae bacterium]|nr:hypothetical protein [Clostridiaceae bacterium]